MRRVGATLIAAGALAAGALTAPPALAQSMVLDPALPAPSVSTSVAADGVTTITLVSPSADDVCVWGIEWDSANLGEHGYKAALRPGASPPSQDTTVPPTCGSGTLPTSLTLTPAEVGAADEIRILWTPVSDVWTFSANTLLAWPVTPDAPDAPPSIDLTWSAAKTLRATATTSAPCHWRFEWRPTGAATWSGTWVGGEPGAACSAAVTGAWDLPEAVWTSAVDIRAAYTSTASGTALSEWAGTSYAYATHGAPGLIVEGGLVRIMEPAPFACRVTLTWLVSGAWSAPAPYPADSCGLPGIGGVAPIDLADAPMGAKQVRAAFLSTPAGSSRGAWSAPILLSELLPAQDPMATEQPGGSIVIGFTDPNPPGSVCVWRWELRRLKAKNVFGAGSAKFPLGKKAPCSSEITVPAALDDPANLDLVLWPDADGTNDPADEAPKAYVDLPDVDLSEPVATGSGPGPSLTLGWWTSQAIAQSVPRAKVSAPGQVGGTCSYRLQWKAKGVAPRGTWVKGPCAGMHVDVPQLGEDWASTWKVQTAWAKGDPGAKPAAYSSYTTRTWSGGSAALDSSSLHLTLGEGGTTRWFVADPPVGGCNAQVQLLSTTDPATWETLSDSYAVPLGRCDDLWANHIVPSSSAAAIRVRMTSSTGAGPTGRWMYAPLVRPADAKDAQVRWNDAGIPVVTFADPNPPGTVCFWQVRVLGVPGSAVEDISIAPDGATSCSSTTTFVMDGPIDWESATALQIRASAIPQVTAIDGWGPLVGTTVEYSPRLAPGKGKAPSAELTVNEAGYHGVDIVGKGCRFIAQWRFAGEQLWRTEPMPAETACSKQISLASLTTSAALIEARVAVAKVDGQVVHAGAWSPIATTADPMEAPAVVLYPGTNRVRVDNQPSSLCGTWFEVRRGGQVVLTSVVRGATVQGPLDCGPWAPDSRMTTYVPAPGDEVRFAFVRGIDSERVYGPWSDWQPWPASDDVDPSVSIIGPTGGAQVRDTVTFRVTASDDVGIDRVEIRSGTRLLGMAERPSDGTEYRITWDSWMLPNGTLPYTAVAFDTAGNSTTVPGSIDVANPPAVAAAPVSGAKAIAIQGTPGSNPKKPLSVTVPRGRSVLLRLGLPDLAGAVVRVRLGKVWVTLGPVSAQRFLPALQVNGPGAYLVRLTPSGGPPRYLLLRT